MYFSFKRKFLSVSRSEFSISQIYRLYSKYFNYYSGHKIFSFAYDKKEITPLPFFGSDSLARSFIKDLSQEFELVKRIKGKSALFLFVLNPGIQLPFLLSKLMENNFLCKKFNESKIKENAFNLNEVTLQDFILNYLILNQRLNESDGTGGKERGREWESWFFELLLEGQSKSNFNIEVFSGFLEVYREFFYGMIYFLKRFYPRSKALCFFHDNTGLLHAHVMMSPLIVKKLGGRRGGVKVERMLIDRNDLIEQRSYLEKKMERIKEKVESLKILLEKKGFSVKKRSEIFLEKTEEAKKEEVQSFQIHRVDKKR